MSTRLTSVSRAYTHLSLLNLTLLLFSARVLTGSALLARAQAVSNAKMHGVITDATGAVVPNAMVTATQTESAQTFTTVSSSSGEYILPNLAVGAYAVKITAPGFQTYNRTGILLQVSNDLAVHAPLTLGSTESVVNVEAGASQVQTEDNSINTVIDQARTVDLPLNGRNAANLILLSGSAAPTVTGHVASSTSYGSIGTNAIGGAVTISVAGGQANQINYLLDGGDNNDNAFNTNLPFPFPDALQEFSVQTTGLAAQYGLHPSGAVNIVTKSGTNEFHGGVFEFLRNNYANASNRVTGLVDTLKRNQYGAYLGGPILHDKLFFFGGYQGTALRITQGATTVIPTNAELAGNFTPYFTALQAGGLCPFLPNGANGTPNLGGTSTTNAKYVSLLAAGFTLAATPGNGGNCAASISPSAYSTVALNASKLMPTGATDALGNITYSMPYPQNENQWIGRLDNTISSRQNVFARYFMTNYSAAPLFAGNLLNSVNPGLIDRDKTLTLGHNFIINPQLTNSLRLTGNRLSIRRGSATDLPNLAALGSNITEPERNFLFLQLTGAFAVACGPCAPFGIVTSQLQATDDVSRVLGKHFIQFGFDYIDQKYNQQRFNNENGFFYFSGSYTGYSIADFLLGAPSQLTQSNGAGDLLHLRENYFGYYAQDTYHLTKKLVVNFGLRWEPWFPAYNKDNRGQTFSLANFNAGVISKVFVNAPPGLLFVGDAGVSNSIVNKRLADFSPRFGFAFDPTGTGKESIRGSYTLLFDQPETDGAGEYTNSGVPYGGSVVIAPNNTCKKNLDNPYQCVTGGNPFPSQFPPSSTVAFPSAGISLQVNPPNTGRPYMNQWNFSYQYQASAKWLLTASYLGTHTVHLYGLLPINYATYYPGTSTGLASSCGTLTPVPAAGQPCSSTSNTTQRLKLYQASGGAGTAGARFGAFNEYTTYAMANYNGLVLTANHQFASNFTALANYTYSKCLSNINYSGDTSPVPQDPTNLRAEYGPCNFDVKHNFTVSGVIRTPKIGNHLLNEVAGGLQVSPLFSYRTGLPFTVTDGTDVSLTGLGVDRPNVVPGVPVYVRNFYPNATNKYALWYNKAAFATAAPGTFGNERPFSFRGPGFANLDLAISKYFKLYDRAQLELRGEAFNTLNHPNYSTPTNSTPVNPQLSPLNGATAGFITSTASDPRLLQIAAKITF